MLPQTAYLTAVNVSGMLMDQFFQLPAMLLLWQPLSHAAEPCHATDPLQVTGR
jgi:hypothetical protein